MSPKPVIALDVDGVVLDYVSGIAAYAASLGHAVGCDPADITRWDLAELIPSLTQPEKTALYTEFSRHETFGALQAYEGAILAISEIRRRLPGVRIVAITSAGSHDDTVRLRKANLESFALDEIEVLALGESKSDHLAALPEGSVFVDDLMRHVLEAEAVGVTGILFRRGYNVADEHVRVVHDWKELADVVVSALSRDFEAQPENRMPG